MQKPFSRRSTILSLRFISASSFRSLCNGGLRSSTRLITEPERCLGEDDAGAVGGFVLDGLEGFVGLVEGEYLDLGFDIDFGSELEVVAGVGAGHVGDAADLALAPEEGVVVEGGHLVEVDGVDGEDASFAKA